MARTATTITDRDELRQALDQVRELGFALSLGELDEQNNAVAVPIRGRGSSLVVAALGVVGPGYRFSPERCLSEVPFLKSVAVDISGLLDASDFPPQRTWLAGWPAAEVEGDGHGPNGQAQGADTALVGERM